MAIKKRVHRLIKEYGTNDPFAIAEAKGIVVRHSELGNVLGFHTRHFRVSIIHINESITSEQQLFTCAHELGHAVLHPDINTSFLKANTLYSTEKIEVEANAFAVELLFKQEQSGIITVNEATEIYGVPENYLRR